MTGDDLARLGARLDHGWDELNAANRRRDPAHIRAEMRDGLNRRLDDYSDAVVLAQTERKARAPKAQPEGEA